MISVSAGHSVLTPTQPVGSGQSQRGSSPGPPHQESCALPLRMFSAVFHDFLYGDGTLPWSRAARQAWFDTWYCVCLAVSFLVCSRSSSEKGGRLPFLPPLLAPTLGWPPRDGLVSAPQLPTPEWPQEERRKTPPRQFFFFWGGGGGGGARSGGIFGGRET